MNQKKICGISTLSGPIKSFMLGNFRYMSEHGYDCAVICSPDKSLESEDVRPIRYIPVRMKWGNVAPFEVVKQVARLTRIFREEKFDIIQYATSNAALYASIAGWLAHVPVRIHLQWGIAYPEYRGLKRWFYRSMEKITSDFSTNVQPDSKANLKYSIEDHLFNADKGCVLYNGSACGVDLKKYDISSRAVWGNEVRLQYGVPYGAKVFGFVGRVVVEKGINELLEAFSQIKDENAYLFLVGPLSDVGRLNQRLYKSAQDSPRVVITGPVSNAAKYFAAFDFMMLPSYREGFGMTVLEAAGVGTPSIVSNIKGPTDFVRDGYNGLICEVKSADSLHQTMIRALEMTKEDYCRMAEQAYSVVKRDFDSEEFKVHFFENRECLLSLKHKK